MARRPERVLLVVAAVLGGVAAARAQSASPSRGELLYDRHCIGCHTAQKHWRDRRSVTDWTSLQVQVRRWQGTVRLEWSDEDVREVSRYLNAAYYHYPETTAWAVPRVAVIPASPPAAP